MSLAAKDGKFSQSVHLLGTETFTGLQQHLLIFTFYETELLFCLDFYNLDGF